MPTPLPSSFASAAAGNTQDPSRRGDGNAGGEWYAVLSCPALAVSPSPEPRSTVKYESSVQIHWSSGGRSIRHKKDIRC